MSQDRQPDRRGRAREPAGTQMRHLRPGLLDGACRGMAPDRRAFLSAATVRGMTLSTAYLLAGTSGGSHAAQAASLPSGLRKKGALRLDQTASSVSRTGRKLVRDFHDPYLELLRLSLIHI